MCVFVCACVCVLLLCYYLCNTNCVIGTLCVDCFKLLLHCNVRMSIRDMSCSLGQSTRSGLPQLINMIKFNGEQVELELSNCFSNCFEVP